MSLTRRWWLLYTRRATGETTRARATTDDCGWATALSCATEGDWRETEYLVMQYTNIYTYA